MDKKCKVCGDSELVKRGYCVVCRETASDMGISLSTLNKSGFF